jgi:hypothetical protein
MKALSLGNFFFIFEDQSDRLSRLARIDITVYL